MNSWKVVLIHNDGLKILYWNKFRRILHSIALFIQVGRWQSCRRQIRITLWTILFRLSLWTRLVFSLVLHFTLNLEEKIKSLKFVKIWHQILPLNNWCIQLVLLKVARLKPEARTMFWRKPTSFLKNIYGCHYWYHWYYLFPFPQSYFYHYHAHSASWSNMWATTRLNIKTCHHILINQQYFLLFVE